MKRLCRLCSFARSGRRPTSAVARPRPYHQTSSLEALEPRFLLDSALSVTLMNPVVAPTDTLWISWNIAKSSIPDKDNNGMVDAGDNLGAISIECSGSGLFPATNDNPRLADEQPEGLLSPDPKHHTNAFVDAAGNLQGFTPVQIPANATKGATCIVTVAVQVPGEAPLLSAATNRLLVDPGIGNYSQLDLASTFASRFQLSTSWLASYASSMDPSDLPKASISQQVIEDDLASQALRNNDVIAHPLLNPPDPQLPDDTNNIDGAVVSILSETYAGTIISHTKAPDGSRTWDPTKPTIIVVPGIANSYATAFEAGEQLQAALTDPANGAAANVISLYWGDALLSDGLLRSVHAVVSTANLGDTTGADQNLKGATSLHLLIKFLGNAYLQAKDPTHPNGRDPADNIDIVAHSEGAVVTAAALSLKPPTVNDNLQIQPYGVSQVVFIGSNLYENAAESGEELSRLSPNQANEPPVQLTNYFSPDDAAVVLEPIREPQQFVR